MCESVWMMSAPQYPSSPRQADQKIPFLHQGSILESTTETIWVPLRNQKRRKRYKSAPEGKDINLLQKWGSEFASSSKLSPTSHLLWCPKWLRSRVNISFAFFSLLIFRKLNVVFPLMGKCGGTQDGLVCGREGCLLGWLITCLHFLPHTCRILRLWKLYLQIPLVRAES